MRFTTSFFVILIIFLLAASAALAFWGMETKQQSFTENNNTLALQSVPKLTSETPVQTFWPVAVEEAPSSETNLVPFTSQAPFSQWHEPVFGGACEESSIIMAMRWVNGEGAITKEEATNQIQALADFQKEKYGFFYDTSTADTARIIKDYYNFDNIDLRYDIILEDIIAELDRGHILIVPVNGQIVANPFYTSPGPLAHMLLVIGYDEVTKEIITHDPGTIRGENFRYDADIFGQALQDYPTGYDEPIGEVRSAMIVISK